jgi:hypothetical protein
MDAMMNIGEASFSEVPVRKLFYLKYLECVISDVSKNGLIMNYTKMNRLVINNNKIYYAISLSR